ncbi:hypothetical protein MNBD_PLANCTO02-3051 [hydrothermal vent metagenome]|uniref:Uncharacterized protein n=1 Tax=hydrothermal vent metagenome TaxID=652676 RepID=A0A3B1DD19_9ZZZZ
MVLAHCHFKEREKEAIQSVKRGVNQTGTGKEKKIIFLGRGIRGIVGLMMFLSGCGLIVFHLYRFVVACTRGELQALVGKILDKGTNIILIGSVVPFLLMGTGIRFMNYSATGDKFLLTDDHPNKLKGKHQKAKKALNLQMQIRPFDDSSGQ